MMHFAWLAAALLGTAPPAPSGGVSEAPVVALAPTPAGTIAPVSQAAPPQCQAPQRLSKKSRALQRGLEKALVGAGLGRHTAKHRLAVAVVDLSQKGETYYAGVNDDDMMYAASLPKIAILLAVAQAASDGQVAWSSEHEQRLSSMITESSNPNASWGAEQVGLKYIEQVMRDPRYCFYDQVHGGLWVGRPYGPGGESNRDPLLDLSHGATARQAARFYALLNGQELVSKEWSQRLLTLMGPPKHHHKFVHGLAERQGVSFLARKSGSWKNWHSDSALIQHGDQRYAIVALSELRNGEDVMQEVARLVDDLIMQGKHRRSGRRSS